MSEFSTSSKKMQIRVELMSILNKYRQDEHISTPEFKKDIDKLQEIEDKNYLCKTLFKEITQVKTAYTNACAIFALETIPNDIFEKQAVDYIKDLKNKDEIKFFVLSLLKQKGISLDYDFIFDYIKEPDKIAQSGVKEFLLNALDDPEVQIDFLDFYLNVSKKERIYLLSNLLDETSGDDLANALSLLAQVKLDTDELEYVLEGLIKSTSPYALEGLHFILDNIELEKNDISDIKKAIKKINFTHRNWKNKNFVQNSSLFKCFIGFVDGKSNFSLVLSRIDKENLIDTVLLTINVKSGIKACMGFSKIPMENFNTIIKRLYLETLPVEISPIALNALVKFFYNKNIENKVELPYEFIVWKKLFYDIRNLNYDVSEFIISKLNSVNLNDAKIKKILCAKIFENWYFSLGQNKNCDKLIEEIENDNDKSFENIERHIQYYLTRDFINNEEYIKEIKNRLIIQSYVAYLAHLQMSSAYAFSLCFDIKYLSKLTESMLEKSIYYYLSTCLYDKKDNKETSIFKSKNDTKFSINQLNEIMEKLEKKWS